MPLYQFPRKKKHPKPRGMTFVHLSKNIQPKLNAVFLFAHERIMTAFFAALFCFNKRNVFVDWMRVNASVIANNERIMFKECTDAGWNKNKVNLYLSSILAYLMCDVLCLVCLVCSWKRDLMKFHKDSRYNKK